MTKIKTIVTGHGNFASGLKSAIELLAGEQDYIKYIDFKESMSSEDLATELSKEINNEDILFFTDLAGGTPFKESAKLSFNKDNVEVVTGCNLGSLLETIFSDFENVNEYANELVKITNRTAELLDLSSDIEESNDEDGI